MTVVLSALRTGAFGLAAAVGGAALYAGIVILTGYEAALVAAALGAVVGFAVAAGHARLAVGWVRALSAFLTLVSLLLSSYLLLWLYDGEGLAPAPISVGEAAIITRDAMIDEPVGLLIWGVALLAASGLAEGVDTFDDLAPADLAGQRDPHTNPARSLPVIQLASVTPQNLRSANLDLAVVMRAPVDGFLLRRLSLMASDLPGALPHLFHPDPEVVADRASAVDEIRVVDQAYDSAEEAMTAAHREHPAADPEDWVSSNDFRSFVEDDRHFADLVRPDAERTGPLGAVMVGAACLALAAAMTYAGYRLNVWIGFNTEERTGTVPDQVFMFVLFVLVGTSAVVCGRRMARHVARRNLAAAMSQSRTYFAGADQIRLLQQREVASPSRLKGGMVDGDNAGPRQAPSRPDPPEKLVERPRVRVLWSSIALTVAVMSAGVGITNGDQLTRGGTLACVGAALLFALAGVAGLRWSIIADKSGVTVTNLIRRHIIRWPDLEDIRLEAVQSATDLGFHYLVFVTSTGKRIRADAPTGPNRPGGKMSQLRQVLLDMKRRYSARP